MLENSEYFNNLFAWYGKLLTDKQQEIMVSYYEEDLSISEIATNNKVSRAAVFDAIKRSEDLLEHYESKLKVFSKFTLRSEQYEKLKDLKIDQVDELVELLEEIE